MATPSDIPSLARLALQYGTINEEQYRHVNALHALRQKEKNPMDYGALLVSQRFATQYQIGLLKLIQEYLVIKKQGEEFGKIAIAKGFATKQDVENAVERQRKEFRRARIKKLIGDILVENEVITTAQKNQVLKEQARLEKRIEKAFDKSPTKKKPAVEPPPKPIPEPPLESDDDNARLSEYEQQFLQVKVLDKDFAASVVEKGLATEQDVTAAQEVQEEEFQTRQQLRILGDIMVDMNFLTEAQKTVILKEQNRLAQADPEGAGDEPETPDMELLVSPDKGEARVRIPEERFSLVTLPALRELLSEKRITHGVLSDTLLQCHLERQTPEFTIAQVNCSPILKKKTKAALHLDSGLSEKGEKRKGDFLSKQDFRLVSYEKPDVFGKKTRQKPGTDVSFRPGAGTRVSKDKTGIIAAKTGLPSLSIDGKLFIHPIIHVLEDADLRYGQLEAYANLSVSGVLTGAYPVTAGKVKAREIRGANITAMGEIRSDVGITDSVIRTQGDVHARYLHNCKIEACGNIYIQNEIIDSYILTSGALDSENCRVITTQIYAKKGICLLGVGSNRTHACVMAAGTEHHVLSLVKSIEQEIESVRQTLDELADQAAEQADLSKQTFQKMVEMKVFHDRAKKKQLLIEKESQKAPSKKKNNYDKLIRNFEARVEKSIATLKELNVEKKRYDLGKLKIQKKIERATPKIERQVLALRQDIACFYAWTQKQAGRPEIKILGKAFQGTEFKGVYSTLVLDSDSENFSATESRDLTDDIYKITISPIQAL